MSRESVQRVLAQENVCSLTHISHSGTVFLALMVVHLARTKDFHAEMCGLSRKGHQESQFLQQVEYCSIFSVAESSLSSPLLTLEGTSDRTGEIVLTDYQV